jgi:hypothetical protein
MILAFLFVYYLSVVVPAFTPSMSGQRQVFRTVKAETFPEDRTMNTIKDNRARGIAPFFPVGGRCSTHSLPLMNKFLFELIRTFLLQNAIIFCYINMMFIIPAIDLKNGQCVRLQQGRKDAVTIYSGDPSATARKWEACGAKVLHVVDLDGAFTGSQKNFSRILDIRKAVKWLSRLVEASGT